ncbi:MAG: hypothetical protein EPN48_16575 [Microbacteriaceae bacterium]|nr:MAG: hypothetical protein EPN48_16575 [Microbacteriaceae bacterium]
MNDPRKPENDEIHDSPSCRCEGLSSLRGVQLDLPARDGGEVVAAVVTTLGAVPEGFAGGRVHRLGGTIALDGNVSWAPSSVRGSQPLNCYLIKNEHGSVLIDAGVRLHLPRILDQLEPLLDRDLPFFIVLTRTEMDCCLNIPAIEARFPVEAIYFTGGITVPRAAAQVRRISVKERSPLALEPVAGIALELFAPRLRLLPTLWPYDPVSQVLFTSDSFAHARSVPDRDEYFVTDEDDSVDPRCVLDQVLAKFSWLTLTDASRVVQDLIEIFGERRIRSLAPTHGRVFTGKKVVALQHRLMMDALERFPQ